MNEETKKPLSAEELREMIPEGYALVEKDGWIPREEAENQLRSLHFDRELDLELTRCGAKSLTAARALLDTEALRGNPEGMRDAVSRIRRENDWLFSARPLYSSGVAMTPRRETDTEQMSDAEYYEYRKQQKHR